MYTYGIQCSKTSIKMIIFEEKNGRVFSDMVTWTQDTIASGRDLIIQNLRVIFCYLVVEPTPLENMRPSNWILLPGRGKHKTCLKPPPSLIRLSKVQDLSNDNIVWEGSFVFLLSSTVCNAVIFYLKKPIVEVTPLPFRIHKCAGTRTTTHTFLHFQKKTWTNGCLLLFSFFGDSKIFGPRQKSQKEMLRGTTGGASGVCFFWTNRADVPKTLQKYLTFWLGKKIISRPFNGWCLAHHLTFKGLQPYTVCFFQKHEWLRNTHHHHHHYGTSYPTDPLGFWSPFPTNNEPSRNILLKGQGGIQRRLSMVRCLVVFIPRKERWFLFVPSKSSNKKTCFILVMFLKEY